jgi:DNA-binding LytR/AlgR family response regulator
MDNYVNVYWDENNTLKTTMLRSTLSDLATQLLVLPSVFRCHRGWLVNTRKVSRVQGNAQGLRLSLNLLSQHVPVSRGNIQAYRQLTEVNTPTCDKQMELSN